MRILVVSDTHRDINALHSAILHQPEAGTVIHLGDGAEETAHMKEEFPQKQFLQVRGNCDWNCALPAEGLGTVGGKKIFYTHGHIYNVKYGTASIVNAARAAKADILLFGHTHIPVNRYEGGLYIMNPGSLHGSAGTYGIIDITKAGIVMNILKVQSV